MASDSYQLKDTVGETIKAVTLVGGTGVVISAIQNTLQRQNLGGWGVFTRFGTTSAAFAAVGGAFAFTSSAAANLRETDDNWNPTIGGFFAGSIIGLKARTFPAVLGYGAGWAVLTAAYNYAGGSLIGYTKDREADEFDRKQALRKNRRRPIEETISELGEGRGIYGPGYAERRKERIRDRYGIEVSGGAS